MEHGFGVTVFLCCVTLLLPNEMTQGMLELFGRPGGEDQIETTQLRQLCSPGSKGGVLTNSASLWGLLEHFDQRSGVQNK